MDSPVVRDEATLGHDNHSRDSDDGKAHAEPKVLENLGYFNEEIREFQLFGGGAPRHVDLEHVGQEGLRQMDGDTTKEDEEAEEPLEILEQGADEGSFAGTVTHSCQRDVTETVEDDNEGDPNFPGVDIVLVDVCDILSA
jgi:hypothetical protein